MECFSRVGWYGYIVVGEALFFYTGGTGSLKKAQEKRIKNYQESLTEDKEREGKREESTTGTAYETEGGSGAAAPSSSDETHIVPPFDPTVEKSGKHHERRSREPRTMLPRTIYSLAIILVDPSESGVLIIRV